MNPIILVHGGADDCNDETTPLRVCGVQKAAKIGYDIMGCCGTALDAVEGAIQCLEDDEVFNCGRGSYINCDREIEMDAGVMIGCDLSTGAVTTVQEIQHPISLARLVLEKTPHVLLSADGAFKFARQNCMPRIPTKTLMTCSAECDFEKALRGAKGCGRCDTVGVVAIDRQGHVAVGSSTGGPSCKMRGRCSDASHCGAGFYCDDIIGGATVTGHGESIIKVCLSHSIIKEMELGKTPQQAVECCLKNIKHRFQRPVGAIALSRCGDVGVYFTSCRMPWAYIRCNEIHYGVEADKENIIACSC